MVVMSLADAQAALGEIVDSVDTTQERVTSTGDGRTAVVILSVDDLEGLEETLASISDPQLMATLREREGQPAMTISEDETLARLGNEHRPDPR